MKKSSLKTVFFPQLFTILFITLLSVQTSLIHYLIKTNLTTIDLVLNSSRLSSSTVPITTKPILEFISNSHVKLYSVSETFVKNFYDCFIEDHKFHPLKIGQQSFINTKASFHSETIVKRYQNFIISILFILLSCIFLFFYLRTKEQQRIKRELNKLKQLTNHEKRLLENLAHEIRTPITAINGYLNLIKNNDFDISKNLSYTQKAIYSCQYLSEYLTDFLIASKSKSVKFSSKSSKKNMHNFITELLISFEPNLITKEQQLYFRSNIKKTVDIEFNYSNFKKIIVNLLSNANKYSYSSKSIYVSAIIDKNKLCFTVKDEGIGISNEEIDSIFNCFDEQYSEKKKRTGIGLFLVKQLSLNMNGNVDVKSEKDVGSIFEVTLPLKNTNSELYIRNEIASYDLLISSKLSDKNTFIDKHNLPKILIVDDNITMISYLKDLLSTKFNCFYASNGKRALEIAKEEKFDLIISDLKMPIMSGFELKKAINKISNLSKIPFIITTAIPLEFHKELYTELGIDNYVLKPFRNEELFAKINHLISNNIYSKDIKDLTNNTTDFHGSYMNLIITIKELIINNITNPEFNVKTLAAQSGYTQQHLNLLLKEKTGLTPGKLILEIRLLKAYNYIIENKFLTLNEVIFAVGLNSRGYFNKVFFKRFGLKPSDLMKNNKLIQ